MTDKDKKRKYLLFKKDDGRPDHLKPCAFFASPEGCRNGSNCKFMHGSAPGIGGQTNESHQDVSDANSVSSAPEPPLPSSNSVKIDNKKRRTNDPGDDAPYPAFRIPKAPSAEDEITKLREQMAMQQKMFEDHLKAISSKLAPPGIAPGIASLDSRSMDPIIYTKLNSIQLIPSAQEPVPTKQSHNKPKNAGKHALSATESSDDEKFLFGTVNQILESGRSDNNQPKQHHHHKNKHEEKHSNHVAKNTAPAVEPKPHSGPTNSFLQRDSNSPFVFHGSTQNQSLPSSVPAFNPTFGMGPAANSFSHSNNNRNAPSPAPGLSSTGLVHLPTTHGIGIGIADNMNSIHNSGKKIPLSLDTNALASNTVMKSPDSAKGAARKNVFAKPKMPTTPGGSAPKVDFKTLDYRHLAWDELVVKTQTHPRYKIDYNLNIDSSWVSARSSLKSEYPVIALDCEMCETEDPVTQVRESTLIRLSVVNGFNPDEVLIDTLVSPQLPISDFRTRIHGITEEQVSKVKYTLRHVQAALLNIITEQTVIVGHSVYNDLKALHLNHAKCIDTAYLFPVENESENSRPSLKLVSDQLLGLNIPEPHDSIIDSRFALYAAAYALEVGCLPIKRSAGNTEQPSLLVHRIPEFVTEEHIKTMIMGHSYIVPTSLSPFVRGDAQSNNDPVGKVTVYFLSQAHADLAFESIQGPIKPDKKNRPQKKIYLQGGGHVYVRK